MDDLQFSWYNLQDHDNNQDSQSFDFDSQNLFLNRTHQLSPIDWSDQANSTDLVCINGFQDIKNSVSGDLSAASVTVTTVALERLLSSTNSSDVSSAGDSVTDDGAVISQCSLGKRRVGGVTDDVVFSYKPKRSRSDPGRLGPGSSNINFQQPGNNPETDTEAIAQMKEMIYREAAFRPVSFDAETAVEKPRRKNVRISSDPQTVAARQRRERISERIRVLQKLVPGGNKMDTASMLDEAANYLKFLMSQVKALEELGQISTSINAGGTRAILNTHASLVVPFDQNPLPMQTHYQLANDNLYPNPPPSW